ncbi:Ubiquitin carboxyl-terminal hydrolase 11 [Phytophthora citrophthora]|uniref:Ubiquitin carboxyl-terminal hydrolase 11 n=1 Tax=Phytophthora citrophthora TaxID=4793 RepID=A0AAD9GS67_9STRA|nr:Ubiquitin carboxyl-terminal hydrolase 11 [Phytophthora citrophthora]
MAPSLAPPKAPSDDESVDLECGLSSIQHKLTRREMERDLVLAFDSPELRRHDAWFLVETKWLDAWMNYVLDEDDQNITRPGPLRNDTLFDREEFRVRENLQSTKDYRGVNPQVYALYAELYGTDDAKPIVRWTLDIYAVPVMIDDVREMLHVPKLKARSLVTEMNEELEEKGRGLEGLRKREEKESWTYRCLCRCEFLVPCLYRLLGGGPTYKKEKKSSWGDCCNCCKRKKKNSRKKKGKKSKRRKEEEDSSEEETSSDEETHGLLA